MAAPPAPVASPRDTILVLLDVVGYTPQARAAGGQATQVFDAYLASALRERAQRHGFHLIKTIGDAALLWGDDPVRLVRFMVELFKDDPIPPHAGFTPTLRMLASKEYFTFTQDAAGQVIDVHGLEGIVLFRLEKTAHLNRVIVTPHVFGGLRHVLDAAGVTFQTVELPSELKGVGADSPRHVYLLRPPMAEATRDFELPLLHSGFQFIIV
jgi:hypothetical protein